MEQFLIRYGLIAVFFGSMIESDITVPTAGALSAFGYFSPITAAAVCIFGVFTGDCMWYWLGRLFGPRLEHTNLYRKAMPKAEKFADKFGLKQIILARFIWGVRIATMVFWGLKRLNFLKFAAIDLAGCILFGSALIALGYFFSYSLRRLLEDFRYIELGLAAAFILAFIIFLIYRRHRRTRAQSA